MATPNRSLTSLINKSLLVATMLVLLPWSDINDSLALNHLAISSVKIAMRESHSLPLVHVPLFRLSQKDCHAYWFEGFIHDSFGDRSARDTAWSQAIRCDAKYIPRLLILMPGNRALAEFGVRERPESAESWFWLANIDTKLEFGHLEPLEEDQRNALIALYQKGLSLSPLDGQRWRELGDLLLPNDPHSALDAYLQSCFTHEARPHGCWVAGKTAEKLGDVENAILYYRFSYWDWAHQRADELEAQLEQSKQP